MYIYIYIYILWSPPSSSSPACPGASGSSSGSVSLGRAEGDVLLFLCRLAPGRDYVYNMFGIILEDLKSYALRGALDGPSTRGVAKRPKNSGAAPERGLIVTVSPELCVLQVRKLPFAMFARRVQPEGSRKDRVGHT